MSIHDYLPSISSLRRSGGYSDDFDCEGNIPLEKHNKHVLNELNETNKCKKKKVKFKRCYLNRKC